MTAEAERRLLQAAVAIACIVPLLAGGAGIARSVAFVGEHAPIPASLDSHFRYLSGLLLGIGLAFLSLVPGIERQGRIFRTLGAIVVVGGLGRLWSLIAVGGTDGGHWFALAMELGVVPLLMLWQARVARCNAGGE